MLYCSTKGSIIRTVDGPSPKVETDPGWEARKAECVGHHKESSPLSFTGSAPELLVSEDEEPF